MLVTSQDALIRTKEKLAKTHNQIEKFVDGTKNEARRSEQDPNRLLKERLREQRIEFKKEQENALIK